MAKYPGLAAAGIDLRQHTEILRAVREAIEIGQRRRGDAKKSFVRLEELIQLGLADEYGNLFPPSTTGVGIGEANTASNVGAGVGVFQAKSGVEFRFKTLVEGANVTLTPGSDTVTIAASGGGAGNSYFPGGW
jgi:hypothetical protein